MHTAFTAHGQHSPPSQLVNNRLSDRNNQQLRAVCPSPLNSPSPLVTPHHSAVAGAAVNPSSSPLPKSLPSLLSPVPEDVASHVGRVGGAKEASAAAERALLSPPSVTSLSPLTLPSDDVPSTSSLCGVVSTPTADCTAARVRVPLSSVVTSLTHKWSTEYLQDAEGGDVDAMCLVAQMYCEGWGALKEDAQEGKRWLERAKLTGASSAVSQLEGRYLDEQRSSDETADHRLSHTHHGRHEGAENGYYSGYANTPISSPSQPLSVTPAVGHGFFAGVAQAISPKPAVAPQQPPLYAATFMARSSSHDQLLAETKGRDLLPLPDLNRRQSNEGGSGSGSGEDAQHHIAQHHLGNTHALMAHGFWKRGHGHAAQSEVSAN